MSLRRKTVWGFSGLLAVAALAVSFHARFAAQRELAQQLELARQEPALVERLIIRYAERDIPRGVAFSAVLNQMGVNAATAAQVVASARPIFNFRKVEAGNRLVIGRAADGHLRLLRYRMDSEHVLSIVDKNGEFDARIVTLPESTKIAAVAGQIDDSLFRAVEKAGEGPELAVRLADIFSWDMDFYTDPRAGDTFRVVVEKKMIDGRMIGYGRILAAEYNNDGNIYRAVLFHDPQGHPAYYTPAGKSLKRAFLHSPLKFGAPITSHFSYHRYHPILKIYRPHLGTDYGAPRGTPVQSIGDGRVIYAGWKGEDGRLVKIQHFNGYVTYYMHLSRLLVHPGQHVVQGQRIGLVGMTGLATGPHLDFRIERHGRFLNFEHLPLPPAQPVARREWPQFTAVRDQEMALLPQRGTSFVSAANSGTAPAVAPGPSAVGPR